MPFLTPAMAATGAVIPIVEDVREIDSALHMRRMQWKTGSVDEGKMAGKSSICTSELTRRCDGAFEVCSSTGTAPPPGGPSIVATKTATLVAEVLRLIHLAPEPYGTPPPPYHETFADSPPSYATSEALASACVQIGSSAPTPQHEIAPPGLKRLRPFTMNGSLDWDSTAGFKSTVSKKQKKAAKKAQQDKWANSDNEDENNAGEGADGGEGGGDGGNAGGDGGDPGDGGGGNDDGEDDWNFGGGKKGKKNKKKAKQEEEERKRQEEEEAKKKADEEAAAANTNVGNPLSWADDANPDDEWGGFAVAKNKKKGKKGKVTEDTPPVPPPPPDPPAASTFHEINLNDDVPNLDFSFGNRGASAAKEGKTFNSNFGAWGASWDFGGIDKANAAQKNDDKSGKANGVSDALGDNNPWSLNNKTKNKKNNITSDFDFGDFGVSTGLDDLGLGTTGEDKPADDNAWGFASVGKGKKGKKGKDSAVEKKDPDPVTVLPDPEKEADDLWGAWGTKKDKKRAKKPESDDNTSQIPPPPAAPAPPDTEPTDEWASFGFGAKKDKKNKKKGSGDDAAPTKVEEPFGAMPETENTLDWTIGTVKNDKKKKKGGLIPEMKEESLVPDPLTVTETNATDGDDWMATAMGKPKKDKKGKKGISAAESTPAPEPTTIVDTIITTSPTATATDDWSSWGTAKSKKDKKGKKFAADPQNEVPPPPPPPPNPEAASTRIDDIWGEFDTKANKKGTKKGKTEPESEAANSFASDPNAQAAEDDMWSSFGPKKDKKGGARKAKTEQETTAPPTTDVETQKADGDTWGAFGNKKDKKGAKKGKGEPSPAPDPDTEVKDTGDDIWASFGTKASKKGTKKGKSDVEDGNSPLAEPKPEEEEDDPWHFGKKDQKGTKKGKATEPEAALPTIKPLEEPRMDTDTWGGWAMTAKDKKKKEKEVKKKVADSSTREDPAPLPNFEPPTMPNGDDIWGAWSTNDTKKKGKKGKLSEEPPPPAPTPPKQGLTPEPTDLDDFVGDTWADLTMTKSKTSNKKGSLSRTTTSTSKGTKGEEKANVTASVVDKQDLKTSLKEDKATKEESAAKAVKSMWGGFGGSTTTNKSRLAKEKEEKAKKEAEKAEEEAKAAREAKAEAEAAEAAATAAAQEAKKGAKVKGGKLSKVDSKGSNATVAGKKKGVEDGLIDLLESPSEEKNGSKNKKTASPPKEEKSEKSEKSAKADVFAMWGATTGKNLKTAGKKSEKIEEAKGEIKRLGSTNQKSALTGLAKELESPIADEPSPPTAQPSTNKSALKTMQSTTTKSSSKVGIGASSSVATRIKALEGKDESDPKKKKVDASAGVAKDSPTATSDPPKEDRKTAKNTSKGTATSATTKGKKKDAPVEEKISKDPVPGSFPGAFGDDDDLLDLADMIAPSPQKMKKGTATRKTTTTPGKKTKAETVSREVPEAPEPPKLPTPPPEKKPVKKERARVERTGAAASWGFWGTAPKKDVKKVTPSQAKDDGDIVAPAPKKEKSPPGLTRSKSMKTSKEKEKDDLNDAEKGSRSSGSVGGRDKTAAARPSTSRGNGFSSFFIGGPPPSATRPRTARRSSTAGTSKSASGRQSIDADASGMISPPPDDELEPDGKAAKLMGVGATKSTKGKGKAKGIVDDKVTPIEDSADKPSAVPDPYAIDDDDMVMVNPVEDPIVNGVSSKNPSAKAAKPSKAKPKSKREVSSKPTTSIPSPPKPHVWSTLSTTHQNDLDRSRPSWDKDFTRVEANGKVYYQQSKSKAADTPDDTVMVDAGGEPQVTSGPDDIAFVDHAPPPTPLKRSNTSSRRTSGIFGGLFGGGGSAPSRGRGMSVSDRPKSSLYDADATLEPIRSSREKPKRRSTYRSTRGKETDVEGFTTDAAGATTEPEDPAAVEARRAERKAKREAREQAAREAEEAEQRDREERRARRKEKERAELEARRAKARESRRREQEAEDQRREEKRARRREREEQRAREEEEAAASAEGRREERRRLREKLEVEQGVSASRAKAERRKSYALEEEDRLKRRETRKSEKSEKSSRRKSMMPGPIDDYFDPRNGRMNGSAEPALHGAPPDKTSSWVNDLADNPPDAPPVEGTVLEDPPTEHVSDDRRARRESRRHSKYVGLTEAEIEERRQRKKDARREEKEKSVSGGSREEDRDRRRKSIRRRDTEEDYDAYVEGGPVKTFDGRPVMGGKRNSWFSKLKGF